MQPHGIIYDGGKAALQTLELFQLGLWMLNQCYGMHILDGYGFHE